MKKKLKNISNKLLDLGKRNRLLNYKETGLRSINILNRNYNEVFDDITNSKTYSFLNIDSVLEKYHKDLIVTDPNDDPLKYSYLKVYDIASPIIKKNQLIGYKNGYTTEKALKSLLKEYKFSIVEKGINTLYLSFYFIKYEEDKMLYRAPLILIPITLTLEKGIYKIKEYEDEIIVNPTLKYYLKTNYKYNLNDYNDEQLFEYINSLKLSLPDELKLESGMALGIYSFLKMNMYNDLTANADSVISNLNIQALLGNNNALIDTLQENPIYPVVNCDSSQKQAIGLAANGKSFVLQGPPGSGKSQTITNIISTLIANGKHVLFVSEKLAALNVVYENLRRAGLSEFAIELHSNKANKKEFIEELYKTARLPKYDISSNVENLEINHYAHKSQIKEYYNEIHKNIEKYNCSLYDIYSKYLSVDINPLKFKIDNIEKYDFSDLDKMIEHLNSYANFTNTLGYDYRNSVFYGLNKLNPDYIRYNLSKDLSSAISFLTNVSSIKKMIEKYLNIPVNTIKDLYNSIEYISDLIHVKHYDSSLLIKEKRDYLKSLIDEYNSLRPKLQSNLLQTYRDSILSESLEEIYITFKTKANSIFRIFSKSYKELKAKLLAYRNKKANNKILLNELNDLIELKKAILKGKELINKIDEFIPHKLMNDVLKDINTMDKYPDNELSNDNYQKVLPYFTDIMISFDSLKLGNEALIKLSQHFNTAEYNLYEQNINNALYKLKGIYSDINNMNQYILLTNTLDQIKEFNQLDYLNYYLDNQFDIKKLSLQFNKQFLLQIIYSLLDKSPLLSGFTSYNIDKVIDEFIDLDEKMFNVNRDIIISKVSKKRPDDMIIDGSKFNILAHEANKLRKQKPIRALLDEIFDLALDVKPIFLMSPLSVSTYLSSNQNIFDCVIFDEASQIFAEDAFGAIYRAKQCIVIGDSKQMPPSNFFNAAEDNDEDSDEMQSILDMASLHFMSSSLRWHYRSRSEELITFSNKSFYDNTLITIPQAKKHEKGFGIDFCYLSDGRYDIKTRCNLIEAKTICDMVFEHFDKNPDSSLGVVAFSIAQANLISDLIEARLEKNTKYLKYFTDEVEEPFFVKNLESVQGDERDRIIFSICYGYNNENKFYQRFGPLNNLGGERRLNVAITRAKYNITVVSSIRHSDIKTENTESLGVHLLHDYLYFAENIEGNKVFSESNDGIIKDVVKFLEINGYECYTNYGTSSFKIDITVSKDDKFILAIMLDKKANYNSNTTDRFRLEPMLLNRLGWKYHRIYSTSWINNNDLEKKLLLDAINNNLDIKESKIEYDTTSFLCEDKETETLESLFRNYNSLDINVGKDYLARYSLEYVINELIKLEEPIHRDVLFKKLSKILDCRITNVFKNMIISSLPAEVYTNDNFYYINPNYSNDLRINSDLEIEYIPLEELKDGIYKIVSKSNGITVNGCYKALIQLLGFSRVTENSKKRLDDALVYLKLDGELTQRGECLFI